MNEQFYIDILKRLCDIDSTISIENGIATGYKTYVFRKSLENIINTILKKLENEGLLKNTQLLGWTISSDLVSPLQNLKRIEIHISKDR